MSSSKIKVPSKGEKISYKNNQLVVPDNPIIPFIEGDGIGVDISPVMIDVVNAAVKSACLLYTSPSPRDDVISRMPSSA